MIESPPVLKNTSGNKSGEILRSNSSGCVTIESLEDTVKTLNIAPEIFKDKKDESRNLRPGLSMDEMKGGFYLVDRFK